MHAAIDGFLRYLKIERNASELTLKSYAEDLDSLLEFFADGLGRIPGPEEVSVSILRAYVSDRHEG